MNINLAAASFEDDKEDSACTINILICILKMDMNEVERQVIWKHQANVQMRSILHWRLSASSKDTTLWSDPACIVADITHTADKPVSFLIKCWKG